MNSTDSQLYSAHAAARVFVIATITLSILGCRSGRLSGSLVQVTEDPSAVVVNIPAPEQRLATATTGKKRAPIQPGNEATRTDLASAVAGKPQVFQEQQSRTSSTADPTTRISLSDSNAQSKVGARKPLDQLTIDDTNQSRSPDLPKSDSDSLAAAQLSLAKATAKIKEQLKNDVTVETNVEVTDEGLVSASLTDLSAPQERNTSRASDQSSKEKSAAKQTPVPSTEKLVESTTNQRPTIRRRPFNETGQPNALTAALEQSLAALPKLPDASGNPKGPAPTRIGTASTTPAEEMHVGDFVAQASAPAASQLLPVAKKIQSAAPSRAIDEEPSVVMNANQVLPVSHAGGKSTVGSIPATLPMRELSEAELYQQLLSRISQPKHAESPTQRERRQIVMRHLMVLAGEPENAVESMEGLNPTEQEYLKYQLMGLWTMIDPEGHPSSGRRITEALPQFREATHHMATATDSLALYSLEFCTEIESYGQIKPFEGNRFVAGQQVILYCEIENFAAEARKDYFQTQLQGSYDIYNASGTKVISQLMPVDQQRSRNRLRDYFVAYQMNLPKGLPAGTYRLQLTIEDVVGKKYGQAAIPFEIR